MFIASSPGNKRQEPGSRQDLPTGDGDAPLVVGKPAAGSISSTLLEQVVDERIHDAHGFVLIPRSEELKRHPELVYL